MSDSTLTLDETLILTEKLTKLHQEEKDHIRKCNFDLLKQARIVREKLMVQYFAAIQLFQLKPELVEACDASTREKMKSATIGLSEAMENHRLALNNQIKAHERFLDLCAKAAKNKVATTYTQKGTNAFQKDAAAYSQSTYAINAQF